MVDCTVWVHPFTGDVVEMGFAYNDPTRPLGLSDSEFLAFAMEQTFKAWEVPTDTPYRIIDEAALSQEDHYFRDAWVDENFRVDMPKARAIHLAEIRRVRNAELVKKDIDFMKALEADDGSHTVIAAEKQVLRDIPQTFDLTTDTPEELKQKWPDGLPKDN